MSGIRPGIEKALELIEKGHRHIVLELPTGYGKSSGGLEIFSKVNEFDLPESRVIHVLPLRAIVEDLARKFYEKLGDRVAYQAGIYGLTAGGICPGSSLARRITKSPFFDADYNVTTFDSFIHNMFKIPVTEVFKDLRHYYIPFERIYTSTIIFDEAHMMVEPDEKKMVAGFMAGLGLLNVMGNLIVIMTATLTESLRSALRKVLGNIRFIRLSGQDKEEGDTIFIHDDEFENNIGDIKYTVSFIGSAKIVDKAIELVNDGQKVLIIINNISLVHNIYEELKKRGVRVGLIHSELTRRDRANVDCKLKDYDVLVGTSAIEAGVDVSFNALITVPDDAASLVQRVGRVCRYGECNGELYFICEDVVGSGITVNKELCNFLRMHGNKVNWRLPYSRGSNTISYVEILEKFRDSEKIEVPNNYLLYFKALGRPYIPHELVNYLFRKFNFNLARSELIDVYVRGKEEFVKVDVNDIFLDSFTIDIKRFISRRELIDCIDALGYIDEGPTLAEDFPVKDFVNSDVTEAFETYSRFVNKYKATPIIIIKPNCYRGM